jgi:hypothetical protein
MDILSLSGENAGCRMVGPLIPKTYTKMIANGEDLFETQDGTIGRKHWTRRHHASREFGDVRNSFLCFG